MSDGDEGYENLIFWAIGIFFGIGLVVVLAGELAAQVTSGTSTGAGIGNIPSILMNLVTNPLAPTEAWPNGGGAAIGSTTAFYVALIVVVAVILGAVFAFFKIKKNMGGGGTNAFGAKNTQWAKRGDLRALAVKGPTPGRLILGTVGGALIATEQRHSVIVLGPTQSGKTTGLAVPSILEWQGPVIATSVKNDLAADTLKWRERRGNVWIYDPTKATGLPTATWSPLDGARTWSGAKKIAAWLTGASKSGGKGGLQDGDFWYSAAGKLLAPHLFAAAANGYTMADVVRWIDTQEEFEVRSLLQAAGVDEAIMAADASWQREDRARSSIYTTAEVVIEAYSDPTVLDSAKGSEIQEQRFYDGGHNTLYVCAPSHEQDRLRPVFSTLLKQFIRAAYDIGKRLDPPLLIVLDEAANIAPLDDLDTIASTCSGLGIQLITVWQDLAQINNRYGDRANTVVNNHRAKIVLSGISDPSTLDHVSRLVGSEEINSTSTTIDGKGSQSRTESKQDKNLAPSDVVRRIRPNEGLLIYGALLPARLILRPWYRSKRLTAMVKGQMPAASAASRQADTNAQPPATQRPKRSTKSGQGGGGSDFRKSSPLS